MRRQEKWQNALSSVFEGSPFELVGVEKVGGGRHTTVRIYIDKPGGVTIEDITSLSHPISAILDVEEIIQGAYTLEVSSPGLDRPLFKPEHFVKQIGQKIALKSHVPYGNRQNFRGLLTKADMLGVELEVDEEKFTFLYADIDKARVIPDIKVGSGK